MTKLVPLGLLLAILCGCNSAPPPTPAAPAPPVAPAAVTPAPAKIEKLTAKHLPNPVRVHEKVISGGLPEGDAAFAELKELGIKTVISVDGAKPDVTLAEKYGMRYVHLPHSYDGVPEKTAQELAKAVRDLPGPIYIHCHHGKHRSPAASAVACVGAGMITHDDAAALLKVAGTSEAYRGLFQSAESAQALDKALLDNLQAEFPATAKIPAMAQHMIEVEHVHDRLKAIEKAGWKTPADMPALVPEHEALLLREAFTELLRTKEVMEKPAKFQELTKEAEALCLQLEELLKKNPDAADASKLFTAVSNNCKACHTAFRDIPLKEKGIK
ncbi:cytochrome c [Anatilimnocola floriformis]|uniref:cytochrome c n=1 Tax=Anatilimnocola floriformis TaxID=2948575 RepID=UPI0020C578A7|nr:cytochrome c [Anatilimnocola floriformis]